MVDGGVSTSVFVSFSEVEEDSELEDELELEELEEEELDEEELDEEEEVFEGFFVFRFATVNFSSARTMSSLLLGGHTKVGKQKHTILFTFSFYTRYRVSFVLDAIYSNVSTMRNRFTHTHTKRSFS
jgi:hypothetical protein